MGKVLTGGLSLRGTVVLCKKLLQKTLNIREMRAFSKPVIMHAKAIAYAKSSLSLKN